MNLGENIYRLRTQNNMSQGDLADALEVSRQSVSKWENNNAVPDLDKLMKMSELFGVSLDELVGKTPPVPSPSLHNRPEKTGQQHLSPRQIVGTIFVCFGLLSLTVILFLHGFLGAYFIGLPLTICGIICLVSRNNILFRSIWGIFTIHAPVILLFSMYYVNSKYVYTLMAIFFLLFVSLIIWSIRGFHRGILSRGSVNIAAVCTVIIIVSTSIILLNTSRITHYDDLHSVEETFIPAKITSESSFEGSVDYFP